MGSLGEDDDQFFDSREEITSVSESGSELADNSDVESMVVDGLLPDLRYELWVKSPGTVHDRRNKLLMLMGLAPGKMEMEDLESSNYDIAGVDRDRITKDSGAVLRTDSRDLQSSSQSFSSRCSCDAQKLEDEVFDENLTCKIRNLDDGTEFIVDDIEQDGVLRRLRQVGSNRLVSGEEFERMLGSSPLVQKVMRRDAIHIMKSVHVKRRVKKGWLERLGLVGCIADGKLGVSGIHTSGSYTSPRCKYPTVKAHTYRKRAEELSAVYAGQDIRAHNGAVLTMKFSLDGKHLATAGEDGILRIWEMIVSERRDSFRVPDIDASHVYFAINELSELVPFPVDKEKKGRLKSLRKSPESACVVLPQRIIKLAEKPVHEFRGHCGEILDLSWSKNKYLLSSSVDKRVRLWRVGYDQCLKVFSHNDYVTCVQFNPVDENFFISGSIDGKVRIWAVPGCAVVDWTDVKEIVTAVCYQPDGKGAWVGSMTGDCWFFDTVDNRLQMIDQICLQGKKKSPIRRITGFQYCPVDSSKLMVTSADSYIRILEGFNVICKYRGLRNAGSQISASFTSDGSHIVSASEDSNVYMWNYVGRDGPVPSRVRSNWSCEHFFSHNASIATPWCGTTSENSIFSSLLEVSPSMKQSGLVVRYTTNDGQLQHTDRSNDHSHNRLPIFPFDKLPVGYPDPFSRGRATWPEEKLSTSGSLVVSSATCKSQYRFLKTTCQKMAGTPHAWGLVIVTAGWDGRIKVFQNYGLPVSYREFSFQL